MTYLKTSASLMEILKDDYVVVAAINGEKALKMATIDPVPDVILLYIMMPGMDGGEVAKTLAADEDTRQTPVLSLSSIVTKEEVQASGGIIGGYNMASKKGTIVELVERIESLVA